MPTPQRGQLFRPDRPFDPSKWPLFYGWMIAAASTVGVVCSIPGQTMGVGPFTEILLAELSVGRTPISLAYMVGTVASGLLVPWVGRSLDRHGPRLGACLSGFGMAFGLFYLSRIDRITGGMPALAVLGFLTLGFFFIRFFGQGLMTISSRMVLANWFNRWRGRVTSFSGVLVSVCFGMAMPVLNQLIGWLGWRGAWLLLAVASGLGFALFAWLFFRDNPEESGLVPDGAAAGGAGEERNPDNRVVRDFTRKEALGTFSFWAFSVGTAFQGFFVTGYTFHIQSVAADFGLGSEVLYRAFLPGSVLGIAISLLAGWIIDVTRIRYILTAFALGMFLLTGALLLPGERLPVAVLIFGMGLSGGCFGPIMGTVWARYFGRSSLGAISSTNMSMMVLGSAFGPVCFSLFLDFAGSYRPMFLLSSGVALLLVVSSFFATNPQGKLGPAKVAS